MQYAQVKRLTGADRVSSKEKKQLWRVNAKGEELTRLGRKLADDGYCSLDERDQLSLHDEMGEDSDLEPSKKLKEAALARELSPLTPGLFASNPIDERSEQGEKS